MTSAVEAPGPRSPAAPATSPAQTWSWLSLRVTALFLTILLPLHAGVVLLRDDPATTTIATVTARMADPRWQAVEWLTLVLALVHGFLALQAAVRRSSLRPRARDLALVAVGVVAVLLGLSATWSMIALA